MNLGEAFQGLQNSLPIFPINHVDMRIFTQDNYFNLNMNQGQLLAQWHGDNGDDGDDGDDSDDGENGDDGDDDGDDHIAVHL